MDFGLERFSFHFPWFSTIFLSLSCFPLAFSYWLIGFNGSPICHLSSFIFISCSCCSLAFLRPNLAVVVAAAIAGVALLVLVAVVIVVLVDLPHDGFKNKEREGAWGGGRSTSPPRRWEDLDVASLCLVVVP